MVGQRTALISSTITSTLVSVAHGVTHYTVEGAQSLQTPGVMAAGTAVFGTTFVLSYAGMMDLLPF